jgi:hypothetical protein
MMFFEFDRNLTELEQRISYNTRYFSGNFDSSYHTISSPRPHLASFRELWPRDRCIGGVRVVSCFLGPFGSVSVVPVNSPVARGGVS